MTTTIRVGLLIDGIAEEPLSNAVVTIVDSVISKITSSSNRLMPSDDERVMDLPDYTMLPGLIDAHVHLGNPVVSDSYKYRVETDPSLGLFYTANSAQRALKAGFTTLRNMGSIECVAVRSAIEKRLIPGPRLFTSGMLIMTGGHTDRSLPRRVVRDHVVPADGVSQVRRRVRELVFAGCDFIKFEATGGLGLSGGADSPHVLNYSKSEIEAIVDEAHALGVRVAAHAHGKQGILRAVKAGADSIEHGSYLDDECVNEMLNHKTFLVPTLAILEDTATRGSSLGYSGTVVSNAAELQASRRERVAQAHSRGVPIVLGTDSSGWVAPHGKNAKELELLHGAGLTAMESIKSACSVAARLIGIEDSIGTIEPGKKADFIIVRQNPLQDLSILQAEENISMVWKEGIAVVDRLTQDGSLKWTT